MLVTIVSTTQYEIQRPVYNMSKRHCTAINQWNLNFSEKDGKGSRKMKRYFHVFAKTRWEVERC